MRRLRWEIASSRGQIFMTAQAISTIAVDLSQQGSEFSKGDMPAGGGFSTASADRGLTVQAGLRGAQYVSPVIKTDFGDDACRSKLER